ncbi:MAG: Alpha-amylase [Rhodanobacteraceae bacterium]|jgi:glycosidase|nr:MAG: Alpha-amylase [Rhodanobacteraceae bacterium]
MRRIAAGIFTWLFLLSMVAMTVAAQPAGSVSSAGEAKPASGVWYEIFVRSWYDTNGDGIGDLNGVTAKLDYLQKLGISGIWLMPINPSPSYHGYDVTNYEAVNPQYGTLADFRRLVQEAHKRGIRVIIDMVANHTSDENPWFVSALDPKSPYRDWYTWAGKTTDVDTPNSFDGQAWHQAKDGQYYLSIFDAAMPDLNYDNPAVRKKMIGIGQFWLKQGADGFRLDAARHLYVKLPSDVGNPASIAKNIAWWNEYRQGLDKVNPHAYLVGEVTRDEAADLAPYLKPLDAAFNFPVAKRLIEVVKAERNLDLARTLAATYATYDAVSPGADRKDAPFLSNHDQERVMSQLGGDPEHMRVAAALLMTLPGEPYIYYGEELGMRGEKPDPDLRTPMRWERALDARGETTWHPTSPANGGPISVAAQQADPNSLLNWYRMLIHWRIEIPALRDGSFAVYPQANDQLVAWQRTDGSASVLVVHNLSGTAQVMPLPADRFHTLLKHSRAGTTVEGGSVHLPPYGSAILQ